MGLFDNFNFDKLKDGLSKTRKKMATSINELVTGRAVIDEKTLDEIILDSGFKNQSHFIKVFKDTYHTTPSKYKRNL